MDVTQPHQDEPACRQCGRLEAHAVGEELLSASCLHARGSCGATPEASAPEVTVVHDRRTGSGRATC